MPVINTSRPPTFLEGEGGVCVEGKACKACALLGFYCGGGVRRNAAPVS
jgi:hypothetical protein